MCPLRSNTFSKSLLKYISTIGFVGYLPIAPGTFGSLTGLLLFIFLKPSTSEHLIIFFAALLLGLISSHNAEKLLGKDSSHIVIDEFCGYALSVLFLPNSIGYLLAAFFLFRFFDILKPPPIRKIERVFPGGLGVMLDDILAAIYTNICIQLWRYLF